MTLEELGKMCLVMLEPSDEDILDDSISMDELLQNDTYAEFAIGLKHSIFSGLTRYVTEMLLPIKEYVIEKRDVANEEDAFAKAFCPIYNSDSKGELGELLVSDIDFYRVRHIYALNENGTTTNNVGYTLMGKKVRILNYNPRYEYHILYSPKIKNLTAYLNEDIQSIWDINLEDLGIDDMLAVNIKYLVYAELKLEENPSVALQHRNIFEQQLERFERPQIANNSVEVVLDDWGDVTYGGTY